MLTFLKSFKKYGAKKDDFEILRRTYVIFNDT